jgi:hypothetical protein
MLGVEAAQFWAAQACPTAFVLLTTSSNTTTTAANIERPIFEFNAFSQFLFMALPLSKSEASAGGRHNQRLRKHYPH